MPNLKIVYPSGFISCGYFSQDFKHGDVWYDLGACKLVLRVKKITYYKKPRRVKDCYYSFKVEGCVWFGNCEGELQE
jgi:hypothetical protein